MTLSGRVGRCSTWIVFAAQFLRHLGSAWPSVDFDALVKINDTPLSTRDGLFFWFFVQLDGDLYNPLDMHSCENPFATPFMRRSASSSCWSYRRSHQIQVTSQTNDKLFLRCESENWGIFVHKNLHKCSFWEISWIHNGQEMNIHETWRKWEMWMFEYVGVT